MKTAERYARLIAYFEKARPEAQSELHYDNPYQLLVAVMLSAQCTDKRVNMVTPALFAAYPDAKALAAASVEDIYSYVKSVSYPNSKSRHLKAMAEKLLADFDGEVPDDVDKLQTLPGVGRKTANVIAAVIFNQSVMPVDTHVFRVSNRIGLTTNSKTPLQTELTLERHIPAEKIPVAHHWLILHGRYVCTARSPHCSECGISDICRHYNKLKTKPTDI
ncbi:MAG: endonuclease III [Bacteroidales bacterium]|jgi:endonuclease-3|nr:endonuclease III [Bacteroidales bacterium]MCR4931993.1 endonuclease III [Bacteroidales bacterium]